MQKYKFVIGNDLDGIHVADIHKKRKKEKYKRKYGIYAQKKNKKTQLGGLLEKNKLSKEEKNKLISLLKNTELDKFFNEDHTEFILPSNYAVYPIKREYPGSKRDSIYLTGVSGSGKSKWIADYLDNYKDKHPDNDILYFSSLERDECFDSLNPTCIKKSKLLEDPIEDIKEIGNSVCIFDDTNAIRDNSYNRLVNGLRDSILETGRHHDITILCTSHIATDGAKTKYPIRESHSMVVFPLGNMQIDRLLSTYAGMNKKAIEKIKKLGSRWVMINKHAPTMILHKRGGYFL